MSAQSDRTQGGNGSPRQSDATKGDEFDDDIPFLNMRGEW